MQVCNCDKANHLDKDLYRKMTCRLFKTWREEDDEAVMHVKKTSVASRQGK